MTSEPPFRGVKCCFQNLLVKIALELVPEGPPTIARQFYWRVGESRRDCVLEGRLEMARALDAGFVAEAENV